MTKTKTAETIDEADPAISLTNAPVEEVEGPQPSVESTAVALPPASFDDLMAPAGRSQAVADEAGLGSEDVDSGDVVLPRIKLLQSLSPEVADDELGEAGQMWLSPHNRPLSFRTDKKGDADGPLVLTFVPVRVYPAWRRWRDPKEGGGLLCEAASGDLVARDPSGLSGAALVLTVDGHDVSSLEWEGGTPTANCRECVYGPAAGARAAGKPPTGQSNPWLPKILDYTDGDGNTTKVRVPDEFRRPVCNQSIDVLALVAVPPHDGMPGEVMPAFISFSRTSMTAGRSLAGMAKLASGEPVWSGMYQVGSKKVTGEYTYFVMTVRKTGFTNRRLMDMARALYDMTETTEYRADMSDEPVASSVGGAVSSAPPADDAAAPEDDF